MIDSYATLLSALEDWNNRADLAAQYPQFIGLAEAHFNRTLRSSEMETTVTQDTSEGTIALPSDYLEARELYIDDDPDTVLVAMSPAGLRLAYGFSTTGAPAAYTVTGTNLVLAPFPGDTITAVLTYYAKLEGLSAETETNWLILSHPDLYLRAVKFYSFEYLKDIDMADREIALVDATIESLNDAGNRRRMPAGPLAMRPTSSA
jgi:hypothetical protein